MSKSKAWLLNFKYNPIVPLLNSGNESIIYFVERDLLNKKVRPIRYVWNLPKVQKILKKQQKDGSWKHYGKETIEYPAYHYKLVETWKKFRLLVRRYGLTKEHPKGTKAAEFILSCQTDSGDIRGMIGNQYATYYTGAMMALLIKAGYANDPRIEKGFEWLRSMQHKDGGWTVPMQTHELNRETTNRITSQYAEPLEPDLNKPSSRLATDMVLRAFAEHPKYRNSREARRAGNLLKSWFFKKDYYSSYKAASYWVRFLFWWPNLMTALRSLSRVNFSRSDPDIRKALEWFIENQESDGLWKLT
ncbi:MAG: hypothetical protein GF329_20720, partial [Candidatus Lokiarchaeota archaeon]|nr:hypothetical protein [Candidatus Lokiarchaeota archaeon]